MKKDCLTIIEELRKVEQAKVDAKLATEQEIKEKATREREKADAKKRKKLAPLLEIFTEIAASFPGAVESVKSYRDEGGRRDRGGFYVHIKNRDEKGWTWLPLFFGVPEDTEDDAGTILATYTCSHYPVFSAPDWATLQPYLMQFIACLIAGSPLPDPAEWKGIKSYLGRSVDPTWMREPVAPK